MEQARREVKHMTNAEYRITMYALKRDVLLKERMYEGNAQCALAIMGAWEQDAQTIANIIGDTVCVRASGEGKGILLSAYNYVDPEVKQ